VLRVLVRTFYEVLRGSPTYLAAAKELAAPAEPAERAPWAPSEPWAPR